MHHDEAFEFYPFDVFMVFRISFGHQLERVSVPKIIEILLEFPLFKNLTKLFTVIINFLADFTEHVALWSVKTDANKAVITGFDVQVVTRNTKSAALRGKSSADILLVGALVLAESDIAINPENEFFRINPGE